METIAAGNDEGRTPQQPLPQQPMPQPLSLPQQPLPQQPLPLPLSLPQQLLPPPPPESAAATAAAAAPQTPQTQQQQEGGTHENGTNVDVIVENTNHDVPPSPLGTPKNPFDDDDDDDDKANDDPRPKKAASSTFNPFDDAENVEDDPEEALTRRRAVTESLAPFTLASMMASLKTSSSESTPGGTDMPGKRYAAEIHTLMQLGFDRVCVTSALVKTSGNVDKAREVLFSRLLDDNILVSNRESYMWRSPVIVRIGGWLPNVKDADGTVHTAYFITVTMALGNETWRVSRRYSEFYTFYCALYNRLCKVFPTGTEAAFPTDRMSNWFGVNAETLNDKRLKALDAWMREICNAPEVMLHEKSKKKIFAFLDVDENMAKIARARGTFVTGHASHKGEGGGSSEGSSRAFRSRSLVDTATPPMTTPSTSAWRTPSCCDVPVMKMTQTRETVIIDDMIRDYSATGGGGARGGIGLNLPPANDTLESPAATLAMRKKAAETINKYDDESHMGFDSAKKKLPTPQHSPARAGK